MVDLAHSFGLTVVAEGVEDEATATRLGLLGVDQAQGYLYSAAVPAAAVSAVRAEVTPDSAVRATPHRTNPSTPPTEVPIKGT
jgi:EAL domain-containing protein (putative c-di-GMP-specific phosphodiesterase class I)